MNSLVSSLISDPLQSHMVLSVADRAMDLVIFPIDGSGLIISRHIDLDADGVSGLEDAIYNNPLLLSEFGKTDILIGTLRFMTVPSHIVVSGDLKGLIINSFWPGEQLMDLCDSIDSTPYSILSAIDRKLLTFIRRTFPVASVKHRLQPFLNFCVRNIKGDSATKMYINLHPLSADIVYMRDSELIKANTFTTAASTDILYYAMLMASAQGFDYRSDEVVLCGDTRLHEEIMPILRKYFRYVMPEMSVTTRYGTQVIDMQVPFELLCLAPYSTF